MPIVETGDQNALARETEVHDGQQV